MKFIKYPSIVQYKNVVGQVIAMARYQGQDENDEAIYDDSAELPTLTFRGTVKLHGTNAGVSLDTDTGELYAQSRKRVITPIKDNAGFALFVEQHKAEFRELLEYAASSLKEDSESRVVTLFGEWCGEGIQKGVAISELEKRFMVFEVKVGDEWGRANGLLEEDWHIYTVEDIALRAVRIDFNAPEKATNGLIELTEAVENECPVAKYFGVSGVGEGVVWKTTYKGETLRFKVKGEKHSASKVKKLASVDVEKIASVDEFVEYAVTESRLEQGVQEGLEMEGHEVDIKNLGHFLKWVMGDIVKEELDALTENSLTPKDISRAVNNKAREWFMKTN